LHLLASNVHNSWRGVLDLSTCRRHRESLGIGTVSWTELLAMVRACMTSNVGGRVLVSLGETTAAAADGEAEWGAQPEEGDDDGAQRPLTVLLRYNIGSEVELEGKFTLQPISSDSEPFAAAAAASAAVPSALAPPLSPPQQLLAHLLFGMFARGVQSEVAAVAPLQTSLSQARTELATLRSEHAAMRLQVQQLEAERSAWLGGGGGLGGAAGAGSYGSQHGGNGGGASDDLTQSPAKRKAAPVKPRNMSILNPNSKRRKTSAIKIE